VEESSVSAIASIGGSDTLALAIVTRLALIRVVTGGMTAATRKSKHIVFDLKRVCFVKNALEVCVFLLVD
jgi:hypothetical protein